MKNLYSPKTNMRLNKFERLNHFKSQSAIVLNLSYTGLAIARSLSTFGIKVYGLGSDRKSSGSASNFLKFIRCPDSQLDPDGLLSFLIDFAIRIDSRSVVFPTRDHDVNFLNKYRERLTKYFIIGIPTEDILHNVTNKWKLFEIAKELGVKSPNTILISGFQDIVRHLENITYPCVLKPVYATDWRKTGIKDVVGEKKALIVKSKNELDERCKWISCYCTNALIQDFISGDDKNIVTYCAYIAQSGKIICEFNTRKQVQYPPVIGTGIIVDSTIDKKITKIGRKLVKGLGLKGVMEVEFKYEKEYKDPLLIEINTRFWDQHVLSKSVGLDLPIIAYLDMVGEPNIKAENITYCQKRWIAEDVYATWCMENGLRGFKKLIGCLSYLKSKKIVWALWQKNDPMPFVKSMKNSVEKMVKRLYSKIIKSI